MRFFPTDPLSFDRFNPGYVFLADAVVMLRLCYSVAARGGEAGPSGVTDFLVVERSRPTTITVCPLVTDLPFGCEEPRLVLSVPVGMREGDARWTSGPRHLLVGESWHLTVRSAETAVGLHKESQPSGPFTRNRIRGLDWILAARADISDLNEHELLEGR